jgi:hypothetical protein
MPLLRLNFSDCSGVRVTVEGTIHVPDILLVGEPALATGGTSADGTSVVRPEGLLDHTVYLLSPVGAPTTANLKICTLDPSKLSTHMLRFLYILAQHTFFFGLTRGPTRPGTVIPPGLQFESGQIFGKSIVLLVSHSSIVATG